MAEQPRNALALADFETKAKEFLITHYFQPLYSLLISIYPAENKGVAVYCEILFSSKKA
jgi:hypothetical protein